MTGVHAPLRVRFWAKVVVSPDLDACWGWTAALNDFGYGVIGRENSNLLLRAHRVSFEINVGLIPKGMCVLHRCDNPPCTNPRHLWLGTRGDNIRDCIRKGRSKRVGIPPEQVTELRRLRKEGVLLRVLAEKYGINIGTVLMMVQGKCRTIDAPMDVA